MKTSSDYLQSLKQRGEKIACLTAYDASFAHWLVEAGVDVVLVGDSLGMVLQGQESTLPVTLDHMIYHAAAVARGAPEALRIIDMPYRSYTSKDQALANAQRLIGEGHGHIVKLEGGEQVLPIVEHLVNKGVPVCGHLGLLPQSIEELGGYKVQGRDDAGAAQIKQDALALESAGICALVLECVPASLAKAVTVSLRVPTIGIGAGVDCDGQVLVLYDMLGITAGKRPSFSKDFLADAGSVQAAIAAYVKAVKQLEFPTLKQSFS